MYQPKVQNTQQYEDSQGSHVVTVGKLMFVDHKYEGNYPDSYDNLIQIDGRWIFPLIISETEEIKEGDIITEGDQLFKWDDDLRRFLALKHEHISNKGLREYVEMDEIGEIADFYKVLALPQHFSDKHLQAIVDGKVKDGDEVLVKTEPDHRDIPENPDLPWRAYVDTMIYLDQQNHITLFPAQQSLHEVANNYCDQNPRYEGYIRSVAMMAFEAGAEWAKNNNY